MSRQADALRAGGDATRSRPTRGPATCASCRTRSSARWWSDAASVVRAADLPLRVTQTPGRRAGAPGSLAEAERAHVARRARGERLEHHARGAGPRRGPGHALQQDPQVRAEEAGERGLRPPVPTEAARLAEAIDLVPVGELAAGHARGARRAAEPRVELPVPRRLRAAGAAAATHPRPRPARRERAARGARGAGAADGGCWSASPGEDIAIPVFTFVFGLARQGGRGLRRLARARRPVLLRPARRPRAARRAHRGGDPPRARPPGDPRALPRPRLPDELRRQHRARGRARGGVLRGRAAETAAGLAGGTERSETPRGVPGGGAPLDPARASTWPASPAAPPTREAGDSPPP